MSAPAPSKLDAAQVLPAVFVESDGSLRTSFASDVTLNITDAADSIKIGNGSGVYAGVTSAGGLQTSELSGIQFQTSQYTIGASAVQVTVTPLTGRKSISLKSNGVIYIGNSSGVTISTGFLLNSGESLSMDLDGSHVIYAISSTTNQKLFALELA